MSENKNTVDSEVLKSVAGGQNEEEYYAELAKFGLIDTEEHLLNGKKCGDCNMGRLSFLRYQPSPSAIRKQFITLTSAMSTQLPVLRNNLERKKRKERSQLFFFSAPYLSL